MRNKDYKTKMREKKKKKKKEPIGNGDAEGDELKKTSRIKAHDYQSWDKFDVVTNAFISYDITNKYDVILCHSVPVVLCRKKLSLSWIRTIALQS